VLKRYVEDIASFPSTMASSDETEEGGELIIHEELVEEEEGEGEREREREVTADNHQSETTENLLGENSSSASKRPSKRKRKSLYEYKAGDEDEEEEEEDEKSSNDLKSILMSKLGRDYRSQLSSASIEEDDDELN